VRHKPLSVDVVDGELRISIGVDIIRHVVHSAECHPLFWYDNQRKRYVGYEVKDPVLLAEDMRRELLDEAEDGTTCVHELLEKAAIAAIDQGSEAVKEKAEDPEEF
jgi:hypothetical protein